MAFKALEREMKIAKSAALASRSKSDEQRGFTPPAVVIFVDSIIDYRQGAMVENKLLRVSLHNSLKSSMILE
jgi:hypothetical protein